MGLNGKPSFSKENFIPPTITATRGVDVNAAVQHAIDEAKARNNIFSGDSPEAIRQRKQLKESGEDAGLNEDSIASADEYGSDNSDYSDSAYFDDSDEFYLDDLFDESDYWDGEFDGAANDADAAFNGEPDLMGYEDAEAILADNNVMTVSRTYNIDANNVITFTHAVYGDAQSGYYYNDANNNKVALSKEEADQIHQRDPNAQSVSELGYPAEVDVAAYSLDQSSQAQFSAWKKASDAMAKKAEVDSKIDAIQQNPGPKHAGRTASSEVRGVQQPANATQSTQAAPAPKPSAPDSPEELKAAMKRLDDAAPGIAASGSMSGSDLESLAKKLGVPEDVLLAKIESENPNFKVKESLFDQIPGGQLMNSTFDVMAMNRTFSLFGSTYQAQSIPTGATMASTPLIAGLATIFSGNTIVPEKPSALPGFFNNAATGANALTQTLDANLNNNYTAKPNAFTV